MKTATVLAAFSVLLTQVAAVPAAVDPTLYSAPLGDGELTPLFGRDSESSSSLEPRQCTFDDGHGPVGCESFTVTFGDNHQDGHANVLTITGSNFKIGTMLDCKKAKEYQAFTSPLPFVVSIHPGNACGTRYGAYHDNLWIKYANQFLNTPSDSRCRRVNKGGKGMRCIIPQRP